jgi:predicted HD phosphohydrolase
MTEHPTESDPTAVIAELFASEGLADYLGEDVTQAVHMLQTAALAERDGAGDALVAAALLLMSGTSPAPSPART